MWLSIDGNGLPLAEPDSLAELFTASGKVSG